MEKHYLIFFNAKLEDKDVHGNIAYVSMTKGLNKSEIIRFIDFNTKHYFIYLTNIVEITKDDYDNWDK